MDNGYKVIIIGVVAVAIIIVFFGYKQADCGQHVARYNYYADQINKTNSGILSSIAGTLTGTITHYKEILQDEAFYINSNCGIIGWHV